MHVPINVKSPNNISEWQMGFNSTFKGLRALHTEAKIRFRLPFGFLWRDFRKNSHLRHNAFHVKTAVNVPRTYSPVFRIAVVGVSLQYMSENLLTFTVHLASFLIDGKKGHCTLHHWTFALVSSLEMVGFSSKLTSMTPLTFHIQVTSFVAIGW